MSKSLEFELNKINKIELNASVKFPEFMRQVRMTMIPSIGYFLVIPKLGQKWQQFKTETLKMMQGKTIDEQTMLETVLPPILQVFSWKFCFVNETELFF
jgi:hypothetical protein